jgi:hypothetical protein
MPTKLLPCISLPPATILSVPIYDYVIANEELAKVGMEEYYECCGKSICKGCIYSFVESGNEETCPFCKAEIMSKTNKERVEEMMKRMEANDAGAIYLLGSYNYHGKLVQDQAKAMEFGNRRGTWIQ